MDVPDDLQAVTQAVTDPRLAGAACEAGLTTRFKEPGASEFIINETEWPKRFILFKTESNS